MDKVRISEIAQEMGLTSKEVVSTAQQVGLAVKAANSSVSPEDAENLMEYILTGTFSGNIQKPTKKEDTKGLTNENKSGESIDKKDNQNTDKTIKTNTKKIDKVVVKNKVPSKKIEVKEDSGNKNISKTKKDKDPILQKETSSQDTKQTLADSSLKKRRGLVIVKKRKRVDTTSSRTKPSNISMPDIVPGVKKKRKVKKGAAQGKVNSSTTMDIFGGDILSDDIMSEEQMVVLHDFTIKDDPKPEIITKTRKQDTLNRVQNKSFVQNRGISRKSKKRKKIKKDDSIESISNIEIAEDIRVYEFAQKLNKPISDVIKVLFGLGLMVTKNDFLDKDAIEILAEEFEVEVTTINPLDELDLLESGEDDSDNKEIKPPVVTVMGHVDHGKTSLLDKIKESRVTSGEHGGITQHIGAYIVEKDGYKATFIDTPGHAAFSSMRARGANITDIIIIVVAADDGVMPQTKEAIEHAKKANVPYIIAINKIDKESANPDMVKAGLAELGVTSVEWGGDIEFVEVSAHTGLGINELLETIHLQAEILELKASNDAMAKSTVIESSIEKGRGPVATVILKNGTLSIGDNILCGSSYGRVKAILDEHKKQIKTLYPSQPGVIVGLNQVPIAGDELISVHNEKEAREKANKRAEYIRQKELSKSTKVTLDDLGEKIAEGKIKSLPIILKADVGGSLEAIKTTLSELRNDEVKVNIISSAVGGITESDIAMCEASEDSIILGFNIRPTGSIKEKAKKRSIRISTYNVIYDLIDDVTSLLSGMLSPVEREENLGQAEVRDVFKVPKLGLIAGSVVTDGVINRGAGVRVIRNGVVIFEGEISSLKRFKDDVKEVGKGYECGIGIVGYSDVKTGDFLESFKIVQEEATL
jgi:translation initiation factor IF-2